MIIERQNVMIEIKENEKCCGCSSSRKCDIFELGYYKLRAKWNAERKKYGHKGSIEI